MAGPSHISGDTSFRRLMDKAPDAIIIYDPDNTFAYVNPAAAKLLNYSRKAVMAKKVQEFLLPAEKIRLESVKEERRHGNENLVEWRVIRSDGSLVDIEAKSVFLDDQQQWMSFLRDITQRKQLQAKLQRSAIKEQVLEAQTKLLEKQRHDLLELNKAKDEFIMLASHQLRTPATAVKQYVAMLMTGYFGTVTAEQQKVLKTAYDANERQMHIINSLLLTAEFDSGQAQVIRKSHDLVRSIKEMVAEIKPSLVEKRQAIRLDLPRSCQVLCDINLIKIALLHIINNASQYSREGKVLTLQLKLKDKYAVITITDQGVGIRRQDRKLLFQKFTRIPNTLTDTVNGNGLGLYLAKQIIDSHDGDISLVSRLNKGSSFAVRLPVTA